MSGRVLLIEDEPLVADMVSLNLRHAGFTVVHFAAGEHALGVRDGEYAVLVLDLMLPGVDGLFVAKHLRSRGVKAPILMLTARGDVASRVLGLESGADDYLPKPFAMPELVARVRALVRRGLPAMSTGLGELRVGAWVITPNTREGKKEDGTVASFTETEVALLSLLLANSGQVLARADILEMAWGMDKSPTERTVDNYVMRLRKILEEEPENPRHFLTLRGVGYRFEP